MTFRRLHRGAQKNTTQHNTTQHNTTQHNTTQHNTTFFLWSHTEEAGVTKTKQRKIVKKPVMFSIRTEIIIFRLFLHSDLF